MINSLIFAFLGYFILAIVAILDKLILTKSLKHPAVYTFYSTIFSAFAFIFLPFVGLPSGWNYLWCIVSGLSFGLGIWTMFIAFRHSEASHLSPFLGGNIAIVSLLLSFFVLGTPLSLMGTIGVVFLICACFLLSFEKSRAHQGFHIGFVWAILSAILFSFSHVSAKYLYNSIPFINGLVWTRGSVCFIGILILLIPRFRGQIFQKAHEEHKPKQINSVKLVFTNKVLGIFSVIFIQYGIALGNVAVVNALAGLQYILMFIFIYWLTKFSPKTFSEYFTKRELAVQLIAVLFIMVGLVFLK